MGQIIKYLDRMEVDGDDQVVLVLAPKVPRTSNRNKRYVISHRDLWKFSEEENEKFHQYMFLVCMNVHELFDLGIPSTRNMAELAELIQGGIEQLLDGIPDPNLPGDNIFVGEGKAVINGQKHNVGITESGLMILQ